MRLSRFSSRRPAKTEIDEAFVARVYRTSAVVWAFGALAFASAWNWQSALGWTIGSAVSFGVLWSLSWVIRRVMVPGVDPRSAKTALLKFSLLQIPGIVAVMAGMVLLGGRSFPLILGFFFGVVLTQGVIFLKVIGILICERIND